jgi:hypothetical protein
MTITALATAIVAAVLARLDAHTFAAIPETDTQSAVNAVAQLLREESAALVEPLDEEGD